MNDEPIETINGVEWYAGEGALVWPSRHNRNRDERLAECIADLEQLRSETDPAGGASTEHEKDLKAQRALRVAGNLVQLLAGWAIDHLSGLAKNNLDPQEHEPEEMRVDDYAAARSLRDLHKYEREGNRERLDLSREQARRLLINFMTYNPGAFPESPQCDVLEAFFRIARGDPDDLFKLAQNGSRYNAERVALQLQMLSIIAFRKALNRTPKEETMDNIIEISQHVGSRIGSIETLKKWEQRLRESRGDKIVDQYLRHGELMAKRVKQVKGDRLSGAVTHDEDTYAGHLNDASLRDYVVRYGKIPNKDN
ncbi:hypothetical protein IVB40_32490 [Bradyrhizobium sp. 40]|uniref:hypothetical protein n=1 Tax=Bradyrhizobium sp. 40 TaxID=2782674 RepID=UPI001FFF7B78|nr:hypothetical protein [Bradyrhizobium sp. 40]UPJ41944.1 hypothetical protein IVB40_32490 [Bradyrhizobium sp. 40]